MTDRSDDAEDHDNGLIFARVFHADGSIVPINWAVRLIQNKASRAEQAGNGRRALDLYVRMTTMAPAVPHAWWQRARLQLVDHNIVAAKGSLGAMLEIMLDPALRHRVSKTLDALPAA